MTFKLGLRLHLWGCFGYPDGPETLGAGNSGCTTLEVVALQRSICSRMLNKSKNRFMICVYIKYTHIYIYITTYVFKRMWYVHYVLCAYIADAFRNPWRVSGSSRQFKFLYPQDSIWLRLRNQGFHPPNPIPPIGLSVYQSFARFRHINLTP